MYVLESEITQEPPFIYIYIYKSLLIKLKCPDYSGGLKSQAGIKVECSVGTKGSVDEKTFIQT